MCTCVLVCLCAIHSFSFFFHQNSKLFITCEFAMFCFDFFYTIWFVFVLFFFCVHVQLVPSTTRYCSDGSPILFSFDDGVVVDGDGRIVASACCWCCNVCCDCVWAIMLSSLNNVFIVRLLIRRINWFALK